MFLRSKLVGLLLLLTIGILPSLAIACAGPAMQSCHPCCARKMIPQLSVAANEPAPLAPCCAVSSGQPAPATESEVQTATAQADSSVTTAFTLVTPPQRPEVSTERIRVTPLAPAQSSLCTFLI